MNPLDYNHFTDLLKRRSGIELGADKAYLLESRLKSVAGTSGHTSVQELLRAIRTAPVEKVVEAAVEAMTTNETFFFRDNTPFDQLKALLPDLVKARAGMPVRIWCAACSTGQEPYSIAMLIDEEAARIPGLRAEILATDLSERCLEKARTGLYSQFEAQRGLTIQRLVKHFDQGPEGFRVKPALRAAVRWRQMNLLSDFRAIGTFDVIFCRNVLIYFDRPTKGAILQKMSERMTNDSRLFLGAAETVLGITQAFAPIAGAHGIYAKAGVAASPPIRAAAQS
ncbi:MAG: protein-glutamate O-methyltransferase CheR [Caulobacteraceae bacterium]